MFSTEINPKICHRDGNSLYLGVDAKAFFIESSLRARGATLSCFLTVYPGDDGRTSLQRWCGGADVEKKKRQVKARR